MLSKQSVAVVVAVQVDSVTVNVGSTDWIGTACCTGAGTERDYARDSDPQCLRGPSRERARSGLGTYQGPQCSAS